MLKKKIKILLAFIKIILLKYTLFTLRLNTLIFFQNHSISGIHGVFLTLPKCKEGN